MGGGAGWPQGHPGDRVTLDRTLRRVSELDASPTEPVFEWDTPLFRMARAQYEQALPYAGVSDMVAERLSFPERAVIVSVPLRRDDGSVQIEPHSAISYAACGPGEKKLCSSSGEVCWRAASVSIMIPVSWSCICQA